MYVVLDVDVNELSTAFVTLTSEAVKSAVATPVTKFMLSDVSSDDEPLDTSSAEITIVTELSAQIMDPRLKRPRRQDGCVPLNVNPSLHVNSQDSPSRRDAPSEHLLSSAPLLGAVTPRTVQPDPYLCVCVCVCLC